LAESAQNATAALVRLLGLIRPDGGESRVFGRDSLELEDSVKQRLAYVPQQPEAFQWMKVAEMLDFIGGFYPAWDASYVVRMLARLAISRRAKLSKLSPASGRTSPWFARSLRNRRCWSCPVGIGIEPTFQFALPVGADQYGMAAATWGICRPWSRQVANTKPRSQQCAGSASKRGCHICETVIVSVRTGSGKLLTTAGPDFV
jgi:hypothetical protein